MVIRMGHSLIFTYKMNDIPVGLRRRFYLIHERSLILSRTVTAVCAEAALGFVGAGIQANSLCTKLHTKGSRQLRTCR